ncbi:outer membrane protein transport protein [Ascidiaceihabitans sp.]|uniref:OmpP1/FadL family transporter n=1 Tax=Ascidiaceihabitans sp. TaxID=1872644 RepID=UPI0032984C1C
MKTQFLAAMTFGLTASVAHAGGLDRSGQAIDILFEDGNVLQLTSSFTRPSITGVQNSANPALSFGNGVGIGNVGQSFQTFGVALKYQFTDALSFAVILDEPFGADTAIPVVPNSFLGGTGATVNSTAFTAVARYKFNDRFSVHGGLRYQQISASVNLGGLAFGGLNGFSGTFGNDGGLGYVVGAAYEIPKIALRVSLTYNSEIDHDLQTVESINGTVINPGSITPVTTPESLNLAFQTGVAPNTLVFGSVRYARNSTTQVASAGFNGALGTTNSSLTDLEDSLDYEIGIGRRFNDKWSGSLAIGYSTSGDDSLVSPLAPTNGSRYVSVGAKYDFSEKVSLSGGIRYTDLGNATAAPGGVGAATFDGNSALSAGFRVSYKF